jgi:hypothetical protein
VKVVAVADRLSSGWYRIRQPVEALRRTEPTVHVTIAERGLPLQFHQRTGAFAGCELDADVLVLERPTFAWTADLIRHLQRKGTRVVVDIDDDFHAVHALNRAFAENHPRFSATANFHHFRRACAVADLVTVSTPALAKRYGAHGRTAILRNCATGSWLEIPHKGDGRTVGWAGALSNHPNDLPVTHGGVARAVEECGARFLCVGGAARRNEVKRQLGLQRMEATDWAELELHPYMVARLDVGIVPLADTRFNHAKSWLKGVESAALGVPFVASPTPEYRSLHEIGLGALAESRGRVWKREVTRLLTDGARRQEMSLRGREIVREHLVIERNAWRWAEAWECAQLAGRAIRGEAA